MNKLSGSFTNQVILTVYLLLGLATVLMHYDDSIAGVTAIVVNNDSGTAHLEDSLTVAFVVTDSLGNIGFPDSFYVAVFGPDGDSLYAQGYIASAAEIDYIVVGGRRVYRWTEAIKDIDGGDGVPGNYSGAIVAVDTLDGASSDYLDGVGFFSFVLEPRLFDRSSIVAIASDTTATGDTLATKGTDQDIRYKSISISGANGVNGSFYVTNSTGPAVKYYSSYNTSTGYGLIVTSLGAPAIYGYNQNAGEGLKLQGGGSASGLYAKGGATGHGFLAEGTGSGSGMRIIGGTGDGPGIYVDAGGGNAQGFSIVGSGSGDGLRVVGGSTGDGLDLRGGATSGHGLNTWAQGAGNGLRATGAGDSSGVKMLGQGSGAGLHAQGGATGDGFYAAGGATSGHGIKGVGTGTPSVYRDLEVSNIDSGAFQAIPSTLVAADIWTYGSGRTIDGGFVDSNKTEQGGISGGDKNLTIFAIDTSGTDDTLSGVVLTLQNSSGVVKAVMSTASDGSASIIVSDGTWRLLASSHGFAFDDTSYSISSNDTVAIEGYDVPIPAPPTADLCRLYGYLTDISGGVEIGANVSAYLPAGVTRSGSLIISPFAVSTTTDSAGYFYLDLIPSDSLAPAGTLYEVTISRRDGTIMRQRLAVPDSTSWQVTW